jgi:hypothetical protein
LPQLDVGHHRAELATEATEQCEDEGAVADRIVEVAEGCGHRLKAAAEVRDGGRPLLHRAKLDGQQ